MRIKAWCFISRCSRIYFKHFKKNVSLIFFEMLGSKSSSNCVWNPSDVIAGIFLMVLLHRKQFVVFNAQFTVLSHAISFSTFILHRILHLVVQLHVILIEIIVDIHDSQNRLQWPNRVTAWVINQPQIKQANVSVSNDLHISFFRAPAALNETGPGHRPLCTRTWDVRKRHVAGSPARL